MILATCSAVVVFFSNLSSIRRFFFVNHNKPLPSPIYPQKKTPHEPPPLSQKKIRPLPPNLPKGPIIVISEMSE